MKRMNMKIIGMAALTLALAACSNDEMPDPLADGPVAMNVTADISAVATRVSVDGAGAAKFTADDVIHVVADETSAYDYTLQSDGGSWSAGSNPYYFQNREDVYFKAWYADPELSPLNNEISIDTRIQEVNDENNWNQWDILVTPTVTANVTSPEISFTGDNAFGHIMSQVSFVFKAGSGISNLGALRGYAVKGITTNAVFNIQTCKLTPNSVLSDINMTNLTDATGTEYKATPLILLPQGIGGNTFTLEVIYNDQSYKANLAIPAEGWQAGYSYTYNVTIKNTKLEVTDAEISGWKTPTEGGTTDGDATLQ